MDLREQIDQALILTASAGYRSDVLDAVMAVVEPAIRSAWDNAQDWHETATLTAQRAEQAEEAIAAKDAENGLLQAHYRAAGRVIAEQRAAIARVWGLHARVNTKDGKACDHCRGSDEEPIPWPCSTIAALAQPGDQEGTGQ